MRKRRLGAEGWGLGILVAMGLAISMTARALGAENPNKVTEEPTITVRVLNYTKLSDKALTEAEAQASKVFRQVGIEVVWLSCYSSKQGFEMHRNCERAPGPTDIQLRVLYAPEVLPSSFRHSIGFSFVPEPGEFGYLASVFYDCITGMAARTGVPQAVVLGHAMAHEIGHLLLGTNRHSQSGIMRAQWSRGEMVLAVLGHLRFTRQEAQLLRVAVLNRERAQHAPERAQPATLRLAASSGKEF